MGANLCQRGIIVCIVSSLNSITESNVYNKQPKKVIRKGWFVAYQDLNKEEH